MTYKKASIVFTALLIATLSLTAAPVRKTVHEFLKMSDKDTTYCELTGEVVRVRNYQKGNVFINDGTGTVLIYGFRSRNGADMVALDVRKGDTLTVRGHRTVFDGRVIEMKYARYVRHSKGSDHDNVKRSDELDKDPVFQKGGKEKYEQWIMAHLTYPKDAQESFADGTVTFSYVVGRDGHVYEPRIIKSDSPKLSAEVLRVVGMSPKWKPGIVDGHPVRVTYIMTINFVMDM